MKQGGLYRREAPEATAELVQRTLSAEEQNTQQGRSGTASEAPGTGSGSEGLLQDSEGLQAAAPPEVAARPIGSDTPQSPSAETDGSQPPATEGSRRTTRKEA